MRVVNSCGMTTIVEFRNAAYAINGRSLLDSVSFTIEAGETVVLRTDVSIACNGQSPTGNMQAKLLSASTNGDAVPGGAQTIPFKTVADIKKPPPPK